MIDRIVVIAWWVLFIALVARIVVANGWDGPLSFWVEYQWRRVRGVLDDDLPEVATWVGVVLVAGGVTASGWAGAITLVVGAAAIAVAVRAVRDERAEQVRRIEERVAETRHDAVVEAVAVEMARVRAALGGAVSQMAGLLDEAVEEILDEP